MDELVIHIRFRHGGFFEEENIKEASEFAYSRLRKVNKIVLPKLNIYNGIISSLNIVKCKEEVNLYSTTSLDLNIQTFYQAML